MTRVLIAIEFLTIARLRRHGERFDREAFAHSQAAYGLVGLGLGAASGGLWLLFDRALPHPPATALAVATLVVLTGALHLDGLADTFDGLLGGRDREARLAIMRDSATGAFGAAAIAVALLLKWSALLSMAESGTIVAALLVAPALARGSVVAAIGAYPYARADGMGTGFRRAARGWAGATAVATALAAAVAVYGGWGAAIAVGAVVGALVVARWPYTGVGGLTGDAYGAIVEVVETGVLLAMAGGADAGWLHPWLWEG